MRNYEDLQVWRKAHDLTLEVYKNTRSFPSEERFGLTSQIRRSCSSIGANIAEGCGRRSDPEMARFSDAITDMLVAELTAKSNGHYQVIGNARVLRVAREQRDLKAVTSSLGASYVVLGQVQRKGDQTRILAHLIHLPDQTHVWVTLIDHTVEDPLALESQVAQTVAVEFAPKIRPTFVPFASHRRASL